MKLIIHEFSFTLIVECDHAVTPVKFDEPFPIEYLQFSKEQSS